MSAVPTYPTAPGPAHTEITIVVDAEGREISRENKLLDGSAAFYSLGYHPGDPAESKRGNPNNYSCRVLVDPEKDTWRWVATPEEAERYPVYEIALKHAISASMFEDIYKGNK